MGSGSLHYEAKKCLRNPGLFILRCHVFDRVAYLMNNAQLHFSLWINAVNRLREAGQSVHAIDQDIFNATVLHATQYG